MQNPLVLLTLMMCVGCGGSPPVVPAVTSMASAAPTAQNPAPTAQLGADSAPTAKNVPPADPCLPNLDEGMGEEPAFVTRYTQPRITSFDPQVTRVSIAHSIHADGSPTVVMMNAGKCVNSIKRGDTTGCDELVEPAVIAVRESRAGHNKYYVYAWPKSLPNQAMGFTFKAIFLGLATGKTNTFVLAAIGSDPTRPGVVAAPMSVAWYVAEEAYNHEIYFADPSRFYDLEELLDVADEGKGEDKDPCPPPAFVPKPPDPI